MNKIRAILVDDEPGNIITLSELLKGYCPEVEIVGTAEDINSAAKIIFKENPDLVFLDIEMPYGNGFDLLERIKPINFEIIFVTAFDNYAIKAFKYAAIDYILKPVDIAELRAATQKVAARIQEKGVNSKVELLLSNLKINKGGVRKIALPMPDGLLFKDLDEIYCLEANANYTYVHLTSGQKHLICKTLGEFEGILPSGDFSRVHNSFIVNIKYVKKYHKGRGGYIVMDNDMTIEVSVRRKDDFLSGFKYEE